jgi:cold shock CspA family protein
MKGKITRFFSGKGYGFATDENNESRFFHISDVVNEDQGIVVGSKIEFIPSTSDKGLICKKVTLISSKKKSFFSIGNTNIKVKNIKEFGTSTDLYRIKSIKVPVYELNLNYVSKRATMGKNPLKWLLLPEKYKATVKKVEVPIHMFSEYYDEGKKMYHLPYKKVLSGDKITNEKDAGPTGIKASNAKEVYMKYLFVTTYQNDNYRFYEDEIDIKERLAELEESC